jgi:internalin A
MRGEDQLGRKIFAVFIGFLWSLGAYGIVGPILTPIPEDHPGSYNAVALVKPLSSGQFKIFCSAFIYDETTLVSAKHCVAERKSEQIFAYLGPNTIKIDPSLLLPVSSYKVYGPQDWQSYFPSFDVSVIELAKPIPGFGDPSANPYFDKVPFLTDPELLKTAETFHLVGYGNQSAELNVIIAGEKKHVATHLHRFVDTPQLSSLIVFQGEIGHSNCHGDSGGPAYAQVKNPQTGELQWFVVGTAAGFDLALTPGSYIELDDEDFPFIAKCDQSQTIYSFIGDYFNWIANKAGQPGLNLGATRTLPPGQFAQQEVSEKDFQWYCQNVEFGDPRWGAVREMMILATELPSEHISSDVFTDCSLAQSLLLNVEEVVFDEISFIEDLEPLSALPKLKKLTIKDNSMAEFSNLQSQTLTEIYLDNLSEIKNLSFLTRYPSASGLKSLTVLNSGLESTQGLAALPRLETLNVSSNDLNSLAELSTLGGLQVLVASGNHLRELQGLEGVHKLHTLRVHDNELTQLPVLASAVSINVSNNLISDLSFLRESEGLQSLMVFSNQISDLNPIANLENIELLDFSSNPMTQPIFGKWLFSVQSLRMNSLEIRDLEFLNKSSRLEKLYIANTKVNDLSPIVELTRLKTLFVGGTPVSSLSEVNSDLCPTQGSNAVAKFCKRLFRNSNIPADVRWRFE